MLPHLNELLRKTEGLGAVIKPYGFSRQNLFSGEPRRDRAESRQEHLRQGARSRDDASALPATVERAADGRAPLGRGAETSADGRFGFASDGSAPVLDDALQRGADLTFGCRMGSCGMCCARLLEGQRRPEHARSSSPRSRSQQGYVLLCQARPLSDVVVQLCKEDEIDQL